MKELNDLSMTELLRMKGQLEQNYIGTFDKPGSYYAQMSAINDAIKVIEKKNLPKDSKELFKAALSKLFTFSDEQLEDFINQKQSI